MGLSLNVCMIDWYHLEQGWRTYGMCATAWAVCITIIHSGVFKNLTGGYILKIGLSQCTCPAWLMHYLSVDQ